MNEKILADLLIILSSLDSGSELYTSMEEATRLSKAFIEGDLEWVDYNYGDDND